MRKVPRTTWWSTAVSAMLPARVVLDIGPGIQPQTLVACSSHICVEPFAEYADILTREHPECIVIRATWAEAVQLFQPKSVDTVVLLDVIEHLEKEEGRRLLDASVALARTQVIVFTPLGFVPQGEGEERDAWGLGGTEWQIHRSGWLPEDFPGWNVLVCDDYHTLDAYGRPLDEPAGVLLAVLDVSEAADAGYELHREQRAKIRARIRQRESAAPPSIPRRILNKMGRILGIGR